MANTRPARHPSAVEVLQTLEEDEESLVCPRDSSSDDEDLLFPTVESDSDLDYVLPSSESDEDCEPPSASAPGPSKAPKPTHCRRTAAPLPGTRKRGRSSLENSAPAAKHGKSSLETSEVKSEEDMFHIKVEEDSTPICRRFMPARVPGPTFDTTAAWSPINLFQLFFSASVVQKIIDNTNANAARRQKAGMKFKWEVLTMKDFYIFLAILLYTGLVTVHHRSDYWSKKWPYNFSFPGEHMRRDRFEAILWSLHLSDPKEDEENDKKRNTAEYDKLFKVKPLYTEMVNACKTHFQPYQKLYIDERMVGTKAKVSFKQYIRYKPTKLGYKLFVLADSATGYTWNFSIYTGKSEPPTDHSLSYSTVMNLLTFPVLGGGYTLFTGNSYSSPALFSDLSAKNIHCCGTIRDNHIGLPQTQTNDQSKMVQSGVVHWTRSENLLSVEWMDTSELTMRSTVDQADSGRTVSRLVKEAGVWINKFIPVPDSILDYNLNMGGVDLSDAPNTFYSTRHKTRKWYKTLFFHFLDIATVNSFLLHKELFKLRQDSTQTKPFTHKIFREQLAKEMLEFAQGSADIPPAPSTSCMPIFLDNQENRTRRYCKRCHDAGRPRMKTPVYCRRCKVALCLSSKRNCFQLWHDEQ